jgi:hypothetical protein
VAVTPDDVYEWGSASATVKGGKGLTRRSGGRYFTAWHRLHGRWLITRNIAF